MRDAINALACRVQFVSMDTPALDHVSYGALADLQSFGGLFCGEVGEVGFSSLFHSVAFVLITAFLVARFIKSS